MTKSEEQKQKEQKASVPEEIKEEDYFEMQKSIKVLEDIIIKNESFRMSQKSLREGENNESHLNNYNDYFNELIDNEPLQMPGAVHGQEIEELEETDNPAKCMTKMSYDVAEEIDEMEEESDSNHEYEISELSRDRNITSLQPSIQF